MLEGSMTRCSLGCGQYVHPADHINQDNRLSHCSYRVTGESPDTFKCAGCVDSDDDLLTDDEGDGSEEDEDGDSTSS